MVQAFGTEILKADGGLDRQRMGVLVFGNEQLRQQLNSILHPFIRRQDEVLREWEKDDPNGSAR